MIEIQYSQGTYYTETEILHCWLGPALEQMTDEQLEAVGDAARQIFDRYPATEDDPDAATEALSGALMIILGDDTLDGLGGAYRQAVEAASEAHGRLIGAVIASRDLGPSEISRQSGLSRVSVTKALR